MLRITDTNAKTPDGLHLRAGVSRIHLLKENDMAVPKRKMSRANTRARRSQWKAKPVKLATCDRCRSAKLPHTACPTCGTYNKRTVLDV